MSKNKHIRSARTGKPEFTPERVDMHRSPKGGVKLHMRAMHLATVRQIAREGQ